MNLLSLPTKNLTEDEITVLAAVLTRSWGNFNRTSFGESLDLRAALLYDLKKVLAAMELFMKAAHPWPGEESLYKKLLEIRDEHKKGG